MGLDYYITQPYQTYRPPRHVQTYRVTSHLPKPTIWTKSIPTTPMRITGSALPCNIDSPNWSHSTCYLVFVIFAIFGGVWYHWNQQTKPAQDHALQLEAHKITLQQQRIKIRRQRLKMRKQRYKMLKYYTQRLRRMLAPVRHLDQKRRDLMYQFERSETERDRLRKAARDHALQLEAHKITLQQQRVKIRMQRLKMRKQRYKMLKYYTQRLRRMLAPARHMDQKRRDMMYQFKSDLKSSKPEWDQLSTVVETLQIELEGLQRSERIYSDELKDFKILRHHIFTTIASSLVPAVPWVGWDNLEFLQSPLSLKQQVEIFSNLFGEVLRMIPVRQ
jgi:DNA-binding response OmpR family regulator